MLLWKALHIAAMFTMVAGFIGVEVFYAAALRSRDLEKVAWVQRTLEKTWFGPLAVFALLAGIVFGVLAAVTGSFDLTDGWLIAAYVLLGLFFVNAAINGEKVVHAGKAAIEAEEGRRSAEEVAGTLPVGQATFLVVANAVLFLGIILVMTLKPF